MDNNNNMLNGGIAGTQYGKLAGGILAAAAAEQAQYHAQSGQMAANMPRDKENEIPERIDRIRNLVERIEVTVVRLEGGIQAVLSNPFPIKEDNSKSQPAGTPLGSHLTEIVERLRCTEVRLLDILARIQL